MLLAGALLLGTVAPIVANADGTTGTTKSSISFAKPDPSTKPVDPDKPGEIVPGDGGGTTASGELTFLYVSKSMDFGKNLAIQTTANAKEYHPTVETQAMGDVPENTKLIAEVADTRGTNAGWTVQVSADKMTTEANGAGDVLTGATLDLDGSTATINNSAVTDYKDAGISGVNAELSTDGTSKTLFSAKEGSGVLNTTFQLDPSNITLANIPANVKAGTYSGNVNWTLSDTPGA